MRSSEILLLGVASSAAAFPRSFSGLKQWALQIPIVDLGKFGPPKDQGETEKFLIETAPGKTQWVTEDEKWELRRQDINFMDITEHQDFPIVTASTAGKITFPANTTQHDGLKPLLSKLSKDNLESNLRKFSSFYTRYYKSKYGVQSSAWLKSKVEETVREAGAEEHITVKHFPHPWGQNSIIATIPGKSNKTVVIGAHQDSINLFFPSMLPAPGADDDGSGTVTILEAFRVLLKDDDVRSGKADNTIEFHWYSAEEGGLLGSQAIFRSYAQEQRDVRAMLQQDMTGFVRRTLDAGKPEALGVITDFVDPDLTVFIKKVIKSYCDIPHVDTKCGYACSDHASASKAGYPSAFVIEGEFELSNNKIHTDGDVLENLSFDHMLQHARLTLGLVYELGFAKLEKS